MKNYLTFSLLWLLLFTLPASGYSLLNSYSGVWVYNLSKDSASIHEKIQATRPNIYISAVRGLNQAMVRRNPFLDAKREIAKGQIFFLRTKRINHYPGAAKLEKQMNMKALFQGVNNWQKIPVHVIRGASFDAPSGFLLADRVSRNQVDIFAQSAYRYAYYWNRTVATHLKQQQASGQIKK